MPMSTSAPAAKIPVLKDQSNRPISAPSPVLTRKVPIIDENIPIEATNRGNKTKSSCCPPKAVAPTAASATVAIIDPT